ncbi:Predicted nucleolar protein involved in ribosome biogenesis [Phaffia rhodozyma]|uniref:Predicted nucleolar protein involved in ribosome biogenesis n=1 Tax=Phaffia rhodozyma TaxID=264483 RepID=A0A0F7SHQ1_PHARH|nr:Predicted nucleolar protein involved in ribosome biogenesis [Phaffia rhodozyma]
MAPLKLKKQKTSSSDSSSSKSSLLIAKLSQISAFEEVLLPSTSSLNPLIDLLSLVKTSPEPEVVHKGVYALGRVFTALLTQNRLNFQLRKRSNRQRIGPGAGAGSDDDEAKGQEQEDREVMVMEWVKARFNDYIEYLGGLLKDVETELRSAALTHLLSFLPLLAPINDLNLKSTPFYPASYIRQLVKFLLLPTPSTRGASTLYSISQEGVSDGMQGLSVENDVLEKVVSLMEEKKDVRWSILKEISVVIRPFLPPTSRPATACLSLNLLNLLESLPPFPTTQKALERLPVLMPGFASSPFTLSSGPKAPKSTDEEDDWRAYFDSDQEDDDAEVQIRSTKVINKDGKKVSAKKGVKKEVAGGKTRDMTIHEGIWSLASAKSAFTAVWLGLFSLRLDASQARRILVILHHQVLPSMTRGRVVQTADWLGEWVDKGGPLGLLALNGLFILMTQYNLEYPDFYAKLYSMLDRSVLHIKYRARFFRLTETFLSSTLLPSSLIASFIKRLARLALTAPPAAVVIVIPFVYNLLKMHPGCMLLIHRDGFGGTEGEITLESLAQDGTKDPYDALTTDPLLTRALDSSLWEIASLRTHYVSSVSSLAKIFTEVFTKPKYGMEDFLDHTYVTMFDTEAKRKIRNDPALALPAPGVVFPSSSIRDKGAKKRSAQEVDDGEEEQEQETITRDIVSALWMF